MYILCWVINYKNHIQSLTLSLAWILCEDRFNCMESVKWRGITCWLVCWLLWFLWMYTCLEPGLLKACCIVHLMWSAHTVSSHSFFTRLEPVSLKLVFQINTPCLWPRHWHGCNVIDSTAWNRCRILAFWAWMREPCPRAWSRTLPLGLVENLAARFGWKPCRQAWSRTLPSDMVKILAEGLGCFYCK